MKVVAYARVSLEKMAEDGVSLAMQAEKVRAYAALYGLEIVELVEDAGASAKTLNRPGLTHALSLLSSGKAEGLLVWKLDRLTRSVRDLGALLDGVLSRTVLVSVSEQIDTRSAGGRLVLNVLMSVAQWEREACSERTSYAMRAMSARGEYVGGKAAFGWRLDGGELVADAGEQLIIAAVREYKNGGLSLRQIGARLADRGLLPRSGGAWSAQNVKTALEARAA